MKATIPQRWWLSVLQLEVFQTSVLYLPAIIQYLFILIASRVSKAVSELLPTRWSAVQRACEVLTAMKKWAYYVESNI